MTDLNPCTYAKIIADSISPYGERLTTMEVRFHRFVLAEMNTHRAFSRNSASSRAIPLEKQLVKVIDSPAVPVSWPAEQKGMQGGDEVEDIVGAQITWSTARDAAALAASRLGAIGVHKSVANRLLEPFQMHTAIISSTAWANFFEQRCSPLAQPEIRVAAEAMKAAYDASTPQVLREGFWHLPYVDRDTITAVEQHLFDNDCLMSKALVTQSLVEVSTARCARVSYETQDGTRDIGEDLRLYDRLVTAQPWHGSPLEHPATPDPTNRTMATLAFTDLNGEQQYVERAIPLFGNFIGWRQHRVEVEAALSLEPLA